MWASTWLYNYLVLAYSTCSVIFDKSRANTQDKLHQESHSALTGSDMITRDYCQKEYFNATCAHDHVIIMAGARYGRMHRGRCVTGSYGAIGCSLDVYPYLHNKCSGRASCVIHTMDPGIHTSDPCPKDLAAFLEASYQCVKVTKGSKDMCKSHGFIAILGQNRGYLSSSTVTEDSGYGSIDCPWRIQASQGQRIRLTQVSFAGLRRSDGSTDTDTTSNSDVCYEIGIVSEDTVIGGKETVSPGGSRSGSEGGDPLKACSSVDKFQGRGRNGSVVMYQSQGFSITVKFHPKQVLQSLSPFVVKYEVEGCAELVAPAGGWIKHGEGFVTLGCNSIEEETQWTVRCVANNWDGVTPNCSTTSITWKDSRKAEDLTEALPLGILMVVAIGVALGVFFGGALLSVVSLILKRRSRARQGDTATYTTSNIVDIDPQYDSSMTYPRHVTQCTYHNGSLPIGSCKTHVIRDTDIHHTQFHHQLPHHHHYPMGDDSTEDMIKQAGGDISDVYDSPCAGKSPGLHHNFLPLHQYQSVQLG